MTCALAFVGLAGCDAPTMVERSVTADGIYGFHLDGPQRLVYRWPVGSTVRVYIAAGDDPLRLEILRDSAFLRAARGWENAVLHAEYRLALTDDPRNADVVLAWRNAPLPVDTGVCPPGNIPAGGVTVFCRDGTRNEHLQPYPILPPPDLGSRVRMLVLIRETEVENPARTRRIVAHELGHVLGIGQHSPNPQDLMYGDPQVEQPSGADRATIQMLYHTEPDITP